MFEEKNTKNNMPAQCEIYAEGEDAYKFMFMAKGGGSANKTFLFQATPSILTRDRLLAFLKEKMLTLGTAACPPYHLAIVIGGTSAELTMKTVKLASARYLDELPTQGSADGHAFRDLEMEQEILKMTQSLGVGAQFGGKYFCHDVRVIRLPRHGASLPIGLGVSCSADRQVLGKITRTVSISRSSSTIRRNICRRWRKATLGGEVVKIDLNQPMKEILATLTQYPIKTRLSLTGTMIVARDLAHAKLRERLDRGEGLPDYFKNHPVYYAGPAKTPEGYASGAFGPTTAGRMDSFVDQFQAAGGSMVMVAKGNRARPCATPARSTAASISARSAARRRTSPNTASRRSRPGISRTRHGSDLAHRGRGFSGLHRHRRQGQRFLQGIEPRLTPRLRHCRHCEAMPRNDGAGNRRRQYSFNCQTAARSNLVLILRSRAAARKGEAWRLEGRGPDVFACSIAVRRTASLRSPIADSKNGVASLAYSRSKNGVARSPMGASPFETPRSALRASRAPQGEGQGMSSRLVQSQTCIITPRTCPARGSPASFRLPCPKGRAERQGVSPRPRRHVPRSTWQPCAESTRQTQPRKRLNARVPHANGLCGLLHVPGGVTGADAPPVRASCRPDMHLDRPPVVPASVPQAARG